MPLEVISVLRLNLKTCARINMFLFYVFFICFVIYVYYNRIWKYRDLNSLPGPPGLPLLGNLYDIGTNTSEVLHNLIAMRKKYGDVFKLWIGPLFPCVIICDPKYVGKILTSTVHIQKGSSYEILRPFLGDGLITNNGNEKWRRHRKLLTSAFHFKILEKFIQTFHSLGNTLIKRLAENAGTGNFNIFPYINRYTLDVICDTSMGMHLDVQNHPDHIYLRKLEACEKMCVMRQFSLIGRKEGIFQFTPQYKEWTACINGIKSFTRNVVEHKHKEWMLKYSINVPSENGKKTTDKEAFLDLLFGVWGMGEITMQEITEEVETFIFAGHDTVASAISFALFELAKHQDVQENILNEIIENIGEGRHTPFTISTLQNLKYLESVCKEVMRLYSTVPYVERSVCETLELDGKIIPKGTTITLFLYGLHNSDKYYHEPEKFNPDRFLAENSVNRNPFTYVPFSAGPRNCIGQRFAMLEYKATIAKIIQNFKLFPAEPEHRLEMATNTTLKSLNGIPVKIEHRY